MKSWSGEESINIGTGADVTIAELAWLVPRALDLGRFYFRNRTEPLRKVLDVSKLAELGWRPHTDLEAGIRQTHEWFGAGRSREIDFEVY